MFVVTGIHNMLTHTWLGMISSAGLQWDSHVSIRARACTTEGFRLGWPTTGKGESRQHCPETREQPHR